MATDLKLFIAGEWTEGTGDDHYEVKSPVTGEHIYNVPKASRDDIDRAVAAARDATEEMRHWTAFERADLCLRIYELWQDKVEEVAKILTLWSRANPSMRSHWTTSRSQATTSRSPPRMSNASPVK